MPISWTADKDRQLFLAILKTANVSINNEAVAKELNTEEEPCTALAVRKRVQKIRSMIKDGRSNKETSGNGDETPKAKATPRKRGKEDDYESPSKQRKTAKAKAASSKIAEADDGTGEDEDAGVQLKQEDDEDLL